MLGASGMVDLIAKYDVPGPRYTSYPTVPYWGRTPSEAEWLSHTAAALDRAATVGSGAGLYVHVPFCESLCTYCGCTKLITRKHSVAGPYIKAVLDEWAIVLRGLGREHMPVSELHLGGGTPTFLAPAELERLVGGLLQGARLTPDAELSCEVDPRVTTRDHIDALQRLGFRRLSLGVQDFDPRVQDIIHRVQSVAQVQEVTEHARARGFTSIGFDLVHGLPLQTYDGLARTLDQVVALGPDRVSFYAYAHVPWLKNGQRRFGIDDLPKPVERQALYQLGRRRLEDAGYREVGMDHFALPQDSLATALAQGTLHRNFMGYTVRRVEPLLGLGMSAIGDAWTAFAQNEKDVGLYQTRVARGELPIARGHLLDAEDLELRRCILDLMTRWATAWPASFGAEARARLGEMVHDGLVDIDDGCRVTPAGRAFVRNVCMAFDARLARRAPDNQVFSRTL